jgi:hypothetical protein
MLELGYYAFDIYIYIYLEVNVVVALLEAKVKRKSKLNIHDGFLKFRFLVFP